MKNSILFLLFVSVPVMLFIMACSIDAYDKGEGEYSLMTSEMADVIVGSDKRVTAANTDQGEKLTLAQPVKVAWIEKGDTTYRTLLYYKMMADGKAEAVTMKKVGVMIPRQLTSKDGKQEVMKTDPLYVESVWTSKNRKYVNMRLRLLTGASEDEKAVQTLGVVPDQENSSSGHVRLVMYHDQGGQPEYYSTTAFVSIPLAEIDADTLTIAVNTYEGSFSRTIVKTTN